MIGQILKIKRLSRGLSRADVANAIGCDRTAVWRIEEGRRLPRIQLATKIAVFLGLDTEKIIVELEKTRKNTQKKIKTSEGKKSTLECVTLNPFNLQGF